MNHKDIENGLLDYLDSALDESSNATLSIAEMLLGDLALAGTLDTIKGSPELKEMLTRWSNSLHDVILAQTNRDVSGQAIITLKRLVNRQILLDEEPHIPGPARRFIKGAEEAIDQDSADELLLELGI